MKKIFSLLVVFIAVCTISSAKGPRSLPHVNQTVDGYRGIWFTLGQMKTYGDKYSGASTYFRDELRNTVWGRRKRREQH